MQQGGHLPSCSASGACTHAGTGGPAAGGGEEAARVHAAFACRDAAAATDWVPAAQGAQLGHCAAGAAAPGPDEMNVTRLRRTQCNRLQLRGTEGPQSKQWTTSLFMKEKSLRQPKGRVHCGKVP
eukprot:1138474-Pelagomonas_calceolata.AAC.2